MGTFKHHTAPVTSVEWHYSEPSVVASAGEDNQVALWDLAVERDDDEVVDEELKVFFTIPVFTLLTSHTIESFHKLFNRWQYRKKKKRNLITTALPKYGRHSTRSSGAQKIYKGGRQRHVQRLHLGHALILAI